MAVTINASTSSGLVQSADTSGQIELQTNGTTVVTVNTSNNVKFKSSISVGDATPTTSGAGITFPATQSASSDANTLDDYEEGTWTPTDASGAGLTFTNIQAQYTKVGRWVYAIATFDFPSTANGSTASIGGLPFTVGSTSGHLGGFITNGNVAAAVRFRPGNNGTTGDIRNGTGTAQTNATLSTGNFTINALYFTS